MTVSTYLFLSDGGMVRHARENTLDGVRKIARRSPGRLFARNIRGELMEVEDLGSRCAGPNLVREYRTQADLQSKREMGGRRGNAVSQIVNGSA